MKIIIDLLLIAIILICTWTGYKKGLIMGVGGILVIIVSIFGANLIANVFSYDVIPAMRPFASGYLEGKLARGSSEDEAGVLEQLGLSVGEWSVEDMIANDPSLKQKISEATFLSLGITEETSTEMAEDVADYMGDNSSGIVASMAEILCMRISHVAYFSMTFLILLILFTVIGNITNLSFKIPNFDRGNDIIGAALGLVTGIMFCMMLVWALKYAGIVIGGDTMSETILAKMFMNGDHLSKILGY